MDIRQDQGWSISLRRNLSDLELEEYTPMLHPFISTPPLFSGDFFRATLGSVLLPISWSSILRPVILSIATFGLWQMANVLYLIIYKREASTYALRGRC